MKDTINAIDSKTYDSIGGHRHSLDQDTHSHIVQVCVVCIYHESETLAHLVTQTIVQSGVSVSVTLYHLVALPSIRFHLHVTAEFLYAL
jgi:hypothetical protein